MRKREFQWLLAAAHLGRWRTVGLVAKGQAEECGWSQAALLVGHAVPWAKWPTGSQVSVQEASCLAGKAVHCDYPVIRESRRLSGLPWISICAVVTWAREYEGWRPEHPHTWSPTRNSCSFPAWLWSYPIALFCSRAQGPRSTSVRSYSSHLTTGWGSGHTWDYSTCLMCLN